MQNLNYHVYADREKLASFKHVEDAALFVGNYSADPNRRITIRHYTMTVWREGFEDTSAAESFDHVATVVFRRVALAASRALAATRPEVQP